MSSTLTPGGRSFSCVLDVEVDAFLHLVGGLGDKARIAVDHADLDGLRPSRRRRRRGQRHGNQRRRDRHERSSATNQTDGPHSISPSPRASGGPGAKCTALATLGARFRGHDGKWMVSRAEFAPLANIEPPPLCSAVGPTCPEAAPFTSRACAIRRRRSSGAPCRSRPRDRISRLASRRRHGGDGESLGPDAVSTSLQNSGVRDRRPRPGAGRIGADRGGAAAIAQIIDIDAAVPRPLRLVGGVALRGVAPRSARPPSW